MSLGGAIALFFLMVILLGLLFNLSSFRPRIPGDIFLDKWGFTLYVPFTSALIASAILAVILHKILY